MDLENLAKNKALKKNKKKRKTEKREPEPELEPDPETELEPELEEPLENASKKKKKKKRKSVHKESEPEPEPEPETPVENATLKFGRRSKDEVNNNTLSPTKSDKGEISESSFTSHKESKSKKRKSSGAEDTLLSGFDTTANSEFESPTKKLKIGNKDFLRECEKLLSLAFEQVKPNSIPYTKSLPSLNYDKISEHFPDKTAKDVKNELMIIIEGTVKIKCLHQLLNEALKDVQKEKIIGHGFSSFLHINNDKILEEAKKENSESKVISIAAEMWNKLPQKEKKAYNADYKEKEDSLFGQTSFEIFYSLLKKKEEDKVGVKEARERWKDLTTEKKVKYIKKSVKKMKKVYEELEEKQRLQDEGEEEVEEEDVEQPKESLDAMKKKVKGPSKDEAILYLKHFGYPDEPIIHLPLYYCEVKKKITDDILGKNRLTFATKTFYDLSKEKQEEWKERHRKILSSFAERVEEWKKDQDNLTVFVWKSFKEPKPSKPSSIKLSNKVKEQKTTEKSKMSDYIKQLTYSNVQVSVAKFEGEPVLPPLDPIKLYGGKLQKKTEEKLSYSKMRELYNALNKSEKDAYQSKSKKIKEIFIKFLKEYVDDMGIDKRKLFLGVKRIHFIKSLGQDIFEKDYPSTEYKVYAKPGGGKGESPSKTDKIISSPSQSKHSQRKEATDEDDEEDDKEEDLKDFKTLKSQKPLQIRNYSSRAKLNGKKLKPIAKSDSEDEDDDDDNDDDEENASDFGGMDSIAF